MDCFDRWGRVSEDWVGNLHTDLHRQHDFVSLVSLTGNDDFTDDGLKAVARYLESVRTLLDATQLKPALWVCPSCPYSFRRGLVLLQAHHASLLRLGRALLL